MTAQGMTTASAGLRRHRLLSHAEVVRLARLVQSGQESATRLEDPSVVLTDDEALSLRLTVTTGTRARDSIVLHNLRLVADHARRYSVDGLTFDDHFQDGCRGLMRAVEKFDPDAGFRFSTYATWWIRQAITRAIADTARLIRLPVHVVDDLTRLQRERQKLIGTTGRAPLPDLVHATGFSREKVEQLRGLLPGPSSLDAVVGDGLTTLGDLIPALESTDGERAELKEIIDGQLAVLSEREREVITLRFGLDGSDERTLQEVGDVLGVTRERVRQIEAKAFGKLRPRVAKALEWRLPPPAETKPAVDQPSDSGVGAEASCTGLLETLTHELAPRARRLLDELSERPNGLTVTVLLGAMGLPPSAPMSPALKAVDGALAAVGLPPVLREGPVLRLDPHVAAGWRAVKGDE